MPSPSSIQTPSLLLDRIFSLRGRARVAALMTMDALLLVLAAWLAASLRTDLPWPAAWLARKLVWATPLTAAATLAFLHWFGAYRIISRHSDTEFVSPVLKAVALANLLLFGLVLTSGFNAFPRSIPLIQGLIAILALSGARIAIRTFYRRRRRRPFPAERVIVYGAGDAGLQLVSMLKQSVEYDVRAFLDDDRALSGRTLKDLPILHSSEAAQAVRDHQAGSVILAMPGLTIRRRREIIDSLLSLPVRLKSIPPLTTVIDDAFQPDKLREVDIEELLGRDPVPPRPHLLEASCRDKVVLVTGAGGSIGSELCRQILANGARRLVLYEISEFALYSIEAELVAQGGANRVIPLLGSVRDEDRLCRALLDHGVETLFHAAAYKHVPMVERNPREGLENNLFGTLRAARAALRAGTRSFVLISTDKAVRPTNVMGASKRLAEMLLQALAERHGETRFVMVRFGNVLGSSGSAVPLFRRQIQAGGPVTVTHPDITRFFMTIPEAVELVLQAAAMGAGGDLFVLDMGEPVRIQDLARRMIRLSGKTVRDADHPDGVEIVFTGLRPGEKLYEETLIGEVFQPTEHPKIVCVQEEHLPWSAFERVLNRLRFAMDEHDQAAIRAILLDTVTGYKPYVPPVGPDERAAAETVAPAALSARAAGARTGR